MNVVKVSLGLVILNVLRLCSGAIKYPVILVPGDGGSQIQAKYNHVEEPHIFCARDTADFFNIWLNVHMMFPLLVDCFTHNMVLHYDPTTHTTNNTQGVTTRVPGWGDTKTVDWLDKIHLPRTNYYNDLSNALVKVGYTRGVSLRAAPYDFRKAANEMKEYFVRFKSLIEETYTLNHDRKIVIIAHSLGNLVTLYFLNNMTQTWKDKYIRAFVTLAAPWGGSMKIMKMLASGFNFHIPGVSSLSLRPVQRSMPSTAWLMPSPAFWNASEVLVHTPARSYTVNDYEAYFEALDSPMGWKMRKDTQGLLGQLDAPNVPVYCLYGTNVHTYGVLKYTEKTWPDGNPEYTTDDGDGTVNIRSLKGCLPWKHAQSQAFAHREFPGVTHMNMPHDQDVTWYILSVLRLGPEPIPLSNSTNITTDTTTQSTRQSTITRSLSSTIARANCPSSNCAVFFLFLLVCYIFHA